METGASHHAASTGLLDALRGLTSPPHFAPRAASVSGVAYAQHRQGIAALGDVYLPDGPGPFASVVLVHGGGFVLGSRRMKPMRFLATRLAEAGIATFVIDYRMLFRGGGLREATDDVATAIAFWHSETSRYNLRADAISVMGLSAGATLAMLGSAAAPRGTVQRAIPIFGAHDLSLVRGRRAGVLLTLLTGSRDRHQWRSKSPVVVAAKLEIPVLVIHGTADRLVPFAQARCMEAQRVADGLPVTVLAIDNAPHGFFNRADLLPYAEHAMTGILEFLQAAPQHCPVVRSLPYR